MTGVKPALRRRDASAPDPAPDLFPRRADAGGRGAAGGAGAAVKPVRPEVVERAAAAAAETEAVGVRGDYPIAFGGGQQGTGMEVHHP